MDANLRINLLGRANITYEGMAVDFRAPARAMALLAFLILHRDQTLTRDEIAFTFWPDLSEAEARAKLRYYLYYLSRDGLPRAPKDRPWILTDKRQVRWNPRTDTTIDIDEFLSLAAEPDSLERAAELYQGELLAGHDEDWLRPLRDRFRQQQIVILATLIERSRDRRDAAETIRYAKRLLGLDQWHEPALRTLVQAQYDFGDRSGAIRSYNEFTAGLKDELGVEPQAATVQLYRQITDGEQVLSDADLLFASSVAFKKGSPTNNLPAYLTAFVGRQGEIKDVGRLLAERRLITLTGIGGIGKSRLAVEVARSVLESFPSGAFFVDLGVVANPELVVQAIASALGLRERPGDAIIDTVERTLRSSRTLLLLDNCEHLLSGIATAVERLLRKCADVRVLATSREPLRIQGECVKQVEPLALVTAKSGATVTLAQLSEAPATHLFLIRAAELNQAPKLVQLDAAGRDALTTICRRLDGIPLAIELAAARTSSLDLHEIARALDDRFEFLTIGNRGATARQQTLRATLDWSYELLSELERRVFERLGVFSGGWSLDAAAAVCGDLFAGQHEARLILASLAEKSLIYPCRRGLALGHNMLETIRSYALNRLSRRGNLEAVRLRHTEWCISRAEAANGPWIRPNAARCVPLLKPELDNIRQALEWSLVNRNARQMGIRLTHAARMALAIDSLTEMVRWLDLALRSIEPEEDLAVEGDLVWELAAARDSSTGRLNEWRTGWEHALNIYRSAGDRRREAHALSRLSEVEHLTKRYEQATKLADEGLALARSLGEPAGVAWGLVCKAFALAPKMLVERRSTMAEATRFASLSGHEHLSGRAHYLLAEIEFESGNVEAALTEARESAKLFDAAGLPHFALLPLANIAMYLNAAGAKVEALRVASRVLPMQLKYGTRISGTQSLQHVAYAFASLGEPERAAQIFGYCDHQFEVNKMEQWPADLVEVERLMEILRDKFEPARLSQLMDEGAILDEATVVDLALRKAKEIIEANGPFASDELTEAADDQVSELVGTGV